MQKGWTGFLRSRWCAGFGIVAGGCYCFSPYGDAAFALLLGFLFALATGNPFVEKTKRVAPKLLATAIVGLGAGMNLDAVVGAGASGLGMTAASIAFALAAGMVIGRLFGSDKETSVLLSVGTAICGGSAIAAVAPVMKAQAHTIAVAMAIVFMLNALALFLFPPVGHYFKLSQQQFGLWSALAIHDTSSVVGAGLQYGAEALQTGVTIKMARALWIIPLTFGVGYFYRFSKTAGGGATKKPWFILGFIIVSAIVTGIPALQPAGHVVEMIAKKCLIFTLFLIGANLTFSALKKVGFRPFLQGLLLWLLVAAGSLAVIVLY